MGYCNDMLLPREELCLGGFIAVTVYSCCCCHIVQACSAIAECITVAVGSAVAVTLKSCYDSEEELHLSINIHNAF